MYRVFRYIIVCIMMIIMAMQVALAAPNNSQLQAMRYSQTSNKVRIVFDVSEIPQYKADLQESNNKLIIDFSNTSNKIITNKTVFNDDAVSGINITTTTNNSNRIIIDLKQAVTYKIFTLKNPNRVVIDIIKEADEIYKQTLAHGLIYTSLYRTTKNGPISAYILDLAPEANFTVQPVLSNDAIDGLETLTPMVKNNNGIAGINGSYFALNGEIIGLMKINNQIVSTSDVTRTALGIMPNGKYMIGQPEYYGNVILANGTKVAIAGVNHERGNDELMLYNEYYDENTGTNEYGSEYTIQNNTVIGINHKGNSKILPGSIILSAHGAAEKLLSGLNVGDNVTVNQSLGAEWDKIKHIVGAGPCLVRNGSVFLTTKTEQFGGDVTGGRAPRTAVGITKQGHLIMAVVDGRQEHSIGMSLFELALFMQELGAVDAMNLDGGGSSEMIVNNNIMNKPSDGCERHVGNAIVIVPK